MSKATLGCASAIIDIRRTLQNYKNAQPPGMEFFKISELDLLEMLAMSFNALRALEDIEAETASLISCLIDVAMKKGSE